MERRGQCREGGTGRESGRWVATLATGAIEEILKRSDGCRHRLLEADTRMSGICAERRKAVAERLGACVAQRGAAWVVSAEIGDQPVTEVVDGDCFHGRCLRA